MPSLTHVTVVPGSTVTLAGEEILDGHCRRRHPLCCGAWRHNHDEHEGEGGKVDQFSHGFPFLLLVLWTPKGPPRYTWFYECATQTDWGDRESKPWASEKDAGSFTCVFNFVEQAYPD